MRIQSRYLGGLLTALLIGVASSAIPAPNATDLRLVNAAERQDKTAIASLVQNGAYVGGTQPDGTTALHWAVHWNDLESADLLMLFGADLNAKNNRRHPLSLPAKKSRRHVENLWPGANPNLAFLGRDPADALLANGQRRVGEGAARRQGVLERQDTEEQQTAVMWAWRTTRRFARHCSMAALTSSRARERSSR